MTNLEPIFFAVLLGFGMVIVGILLGPSFFSAYQNWKIQRGARK